MLILRIYHGLMILAIAGIGHNVCNAQAAFFPLQRQLCLEGPEGIQGQGTSITLATQAADATGIVTGPAINNILLEDRNFMTDPEDSAATIGNTVATSDGVPTAETLPAETYSAAIGESTASIGGIWSLTTGAAPSAAWVDNRQQAIAQGRFIVLANPTYPTVTTGTIQIEFNLMNASDYQNVYMSARCDGSYIEVMQDANGYMMVGYLEGYGSISDSDSGPYPGGVYTASRSASVNDGLTTYANVYGDLGNGGLGLNDANSADGGTASISATTSVFVSNP